MAEKLAQSATGHAQVLAHVFSILAAVSKVLYLGSCYHCAIDQLPAMRFQLFLVVLVVLVSMVLGKPHENEAARSLKYRAPGMLGHIFAPIQDRIQSHLRGDVRATPKWKKNRSKYI
ncbi:unnamed protein product [Aphanomyces euteiches]|uniref:Uncharacterized protein n=2 Tax=Aphanomyces euteiches TaxID=100861 RepID=A0A6G0X6T5_9STRA|nr:hypothetical protein Ae201684_007727 [Aphanomyces euteiches]KAH9067211.1 hypothetical protein Ae201684P_021375 [Aphanomyces euteiches]KAH9142923.1 hypothetical protein AeRB84_013043 [Aphanomyces euteiches]